MIKEALAKVVERKDLSAAEAEGVMQEIMSGEATPAQIGAFLTALRMKGETAEEIAGSARAMRRNAIPVRPHRQDLVDTCGTGGDGANTFNISTTVAFVAAGAGLAVAKHGNYSVSSRSGSADLMLALGANINLPPEEIARCIDEVGVGFLFAPALHPAMKHALGPRKEIALRTIFNILGPLTNPAGAAVQLLGVYKPELTELLARVLGALGSRDAFVVHGAHGLDELSVTGGNRVSRLSGGQVKTYLLDPAALGLPRAKLSDLSGDTPEENATITRGVLGGQKGPRRDVVLLNAAAVLVAAGRAANLKEGLSLAAEAIDTGQALEKLKAFVEMTQSLGRKQKA